MPWKRAHVSPDQHKILKRLKKTSDKHFDGEAFTLAQAKDVMKPDQYYRMLAMGPTFKDSKNQKKAFDSYIRGTTAPEILHDELREELQPLLKNRIKGHHLYHFGNKIATLDCFSDTTYRFDDGCLAQRFLLENITSDRKMAKGANDTIKAYKFIAKILKLKGWNKAIPLQNFSNNKINEAVKDGLQIHKYGDMLRKFAVGDIGSASLSVFLTVMENTKKFKTSAGLLGLGIYVLKNHGAFVDGAEWTASKIWKNRRINQPKESTPESGITPPTTTEPKTTPETTTEPGITPPTTTEPKTTPETTTEPGVNPEKNTSDGANLKCKQEWSDLHKTFLETCTGDFNGGFKYEGKVSVDSSSRTQVAGNQRRDRFQLTRLDGDYGSYDPFIPKLTHKVGSGELVRLWVSTSGQNDPVWSFIFYDRGYMEARRRCLNKTRREDDPLSYEQVEKMFLDDEKGHATYVNGVYNGYHDEPLYRIDIGTGYSKTIGVSTAGASRALPESEDWANASYHVCTESVYPDERKYELELIPMAYS